jgi:hypothetical protein
MTQKDISRWNKTIKNAKDYMKRHHQSWRGLLDSYDLRYEIPGMAGDEAIKISRFVPKVRKIIASIAYNYPTVFLKVDDPPIDPQTGEPVENLSEVLQRGANDMMEVMRVKPEIHQMIFDALFKFRGWIKGGYNPPGSDSIMPWVANDYLEDDFPYITHVPAENLFVDPLVKANNLSTARFVVEEMLVPLEFAKQDERFVHRSKMKPYGGPDKDQLIATFADEETPKTWTQEEEELMRETLDIGEFVLLHEVHDRIHRKRITFANEVEQPVEDIDHPFAFSQPINVPDPLGTGREIFSGEREEEVEGFLMEGGFCYYTMQIDLSERFYGVPVMGYQNDLQNLIVESLTRRVDILDRGKTILLMNKAEKVANDDIGSNLKQSDDGDILTVSDLNNFREVQLGTPPPDQKSLEYDARGYENELLEVGAVQSNTATEAAAFMTDAQLNKEWMQTPVQEAYQWIVRSCFSLMSDPNFTPEQWNLNMAKEGEIPVEAALQNWWLTGKHRVEIEAGSMQILVEQLRRNDTLQLSSMLMNRPEIDQKQLIEMVISAFNVGQGHDLFADDVNTDAISTANLEHQLMMLGQNVPVLNGQSHDVHFEQHQLWAAQQLPQLVAPQMLPQVQQILNVHMQAHQQKLQEQGATLGTRAGGGGTAAAAAAEGPETIQSAVQSNAQTLSRGIQAETRERFG